MNAVFCGSQALAKPPKSPEKRLRSLDVDLSLASLKAGLDRLQTSPGECNICCGVTLQKRALRKMLKPIPNVAHDARALRTSRRSAREKGNGLMPLRMFVLMRSGCPVDRSFSVGVP